TQDPPAQRPRHGRQPLPVYRQYVPMLLLIAIELDNGERYKVGFKGMKAPEFKYVQNQFANQPGFFQLLNPP
ncbi:MAG: hypothetical protein ACLP2Y_07365, partial [Limisphaerales bacterium]